jgi:hypothetical protein
MNEEEYPSLRITEEDIAEANQLSLHCPICASAVENNVDGEAMRPIICAKCGTLYHKICWEQSGGKCAILGCEHDTYHIHGQYLGPALKVDYGDLKPPSANGGKTSGRTRRLKDEQRRQVEELRRPSLLQRLWQWLLDQIKFE